jgi:hypothetical protein
VIDLGGASVGQEGVVGKVGAQQDEQVGLVGGLVGGAVAEQAAHADVVGIVVLDPFLAAKGVTDRREDPAGQGHDFVVCAAHARTDEQRDLLGAVDGVGEPTSSQKWLQSVKTRSGWVSWKKPVPIWRVGMCAAMASTGAPLRWAS